MKLSARNQLKGKVLEVKMGQTTAHVRLDIGGAIITASITNEAVDDLALKVGMDAYAVIKASDVMVAVPDGERGDQCRSGAISSRPPSAIVRRSDRSMPKDI